MLLEDFLPLIPTDIINIINGYVDVYIYFDEKNDNNIKIKVNAEKLTCNCDMFRDYRHICKHILRIFK
jgi:hypothetical protein